MFTEEARLGRCQCSFERIASTLNAEANNEWRNQYLSAAVALAMCLHKALATVLPIPDEPPGAFRRRREARDGKSKFGADRSAECSLLSVGRRIASTLESRQLEDSAPMVQHGENKRPLIFLHDRGIGAAPNLFLRSSSILSCRVRTTD